LVSPFQQINIVFWDALDPTTIQQQTVDGKCPSGFKQSTTTCDASNLKQQIPFFPWDIPIFQPVVNFMEQYLSTWNPSNPAWIVLWNATNLISLFLFEWM